MKRWTVALFVALTTLGLFALGFWLVHGVTFDVLQPTGEVGIKQRNILFFTLGLSAIVVVPVFILLVVFAWKYHESNTKANYRPNWSSNTKLEAIWWGIPITIIGILSVVTVITSHSLDPYKKLASTEPAINVQVIGLQWKWLFLYPDYGIATVNQLPVATNTPIHFSLTGDAPMNGFWIPSLGSQIYAMNGMNSQLNLMANKNGDYMGYATNINGPGYSDMKFTVRALDKSAFKTWIKKAAHSTEKLDKPQYDVLARPNTTGEHTYALADSSLYDTIMNKYMGNQINQQTGSMKSMHNDHTMDGM